MVDTPQIVKSNGLSNEAIRATMAGSPASELRIEVEQEIDSTNAALKRRAVSEDIHGLALFAEAQTAGRGRLGRPWVSPPKSNIYMSLGWRTGLEPLELAGLSLAVGCAIAEGLEGDLVLDIKLKWPNDLYLGGKKCGGVLIDLVQSANQDWIIVVGVGLNVAMSDLGGDDIDQPWTDLQTVAPSAVSRNFLVASLIKSLFKVLCDFPECGFAGYRDEWQSADLLKGSQGTVSNPSGSISGTILGVDSVGALRMQLTSGEEQRFIGGELSLRGNL